MGYNIIVITAAFALSWTLVSAVPPPVCLQCQQSKTCNPPDCSCCRDDLKIPNIAVKQIPQMVFFTFDDAVTSTVSGFYQELFDSARKNPNGCSISMTLFISHHNTDYRLVSDFYRKGMEIASHSVTHSHMNGSNFLEEAKSQKENLAKLANIPIDEITGWRSPFLKPAGDFQPDALKRLGYTYDATLTFSKRSLNERPPGPFTLDFGFPYECQVKPCPERNHPGFWEVPVVSLMDFKQKYDCVYVDGCMNAPPDEESAYKFLWDNFNNYYTTTRMPFGINMHPSWFFYPDRLRAMDRFIKKLVSLNDVYIISANRMLEWLKYPTPLSEVHSFAPWACDGREKNSKLGPRLVKTNLPPPPMSWMPRARSNSREMITTRKRRPANMFTPAPVLAQRQFTSNNRASLSPRVTPSRAPIVVQVAQLFTPRHENVRSDFSRDLERQQRRIREEILKRQIRHWQLQRARQNSMEVPQPARNTQNTGNSVQVVPNNRRNNNMNNDNRNTNSQVAQTPAVRKKLTQREIMEQHEQRLRQHQLLEERQVRLETERLKTQQLEKLTNIQESPQVVLHPLNDIPVLKPDQVINPVKPFEPKQKHILWHSNLAPALHPAETRQGRPVKIQQQTIKPWPTLAPTRAPTLRPVNSRAVKRFNDRNFVTGPGNELSRLRNKLRRPVSPGIVKPTANPARRFVTYSDQPVWYDNFGNRLNSFNTDNSHLQRGGSNRRSGFIESNSIPVRTGSFRRVHPSRLRRINETQFNDIRHNRVAHTPVQADFLSQSNSQPVSLHDNSVSLNRNLVSRRNSISPSVSQRIAWNNFIRQMFGPHR